MSHCWFVGEHRQQQQVPDLRLLHLTRHILQRYSTQTSLGVGVDLGVGQALQGMQ